MALADKFLELENLEYFDIFDEDEKDVAKLRALDFNLKEISKITSLEIGRVKYLSKKIVKKIKAKQGKID